MKVQYPQSELWIGSDDGGGDIYNNKTILIYDEHVHLKQKKKM